jgi:hypothetical protein
MVAKRKRNAIDYAQLNAFSSVVLYKYGIKRKKGTLYEAEISKYQINLRKLLPQIMPAFQTLVLYIST